MGSILGLLNIISVKSNINQNISHILELYWLKFSSHNLQALAQTKNLDPPYVCVLFVMYLSKYLGNEPWLRLISKFHT